MKKWKVYWVIGLLGMMTAITSATLQISVATDKPVYQVGETVSVSVSVYNPTASPVMMTFGDSLLATYLLDETYYWHTSVISTPSIVHLTLQPEQTLSWLLKHGTTQSIDYPLEIGVHTVKGTLLSSVTWGQFSEPAVFQVVPEPMTLSLLGLGFLVLRKK